VNPSKKTMPDIERTENAPAGDGGLPGRPLSGHVALRRLLPRRRRGGGHGVSSVRPDVGAAAVIDPEVRRRYSLMASEWARDLLAAGYFVALDSETTGLGKDAQFVELAIVEHDGSPEGRALFNLRIRPSCSGTPAFWQSPTNAPSAPTATP
jgi:hypothetical protein